mmetsp:Transcript_47652/g.90951  ORF Transcript_47652/g.90951 Transcript_47652/m.90951 type:complete len:226 (-) Transcript_47652:236-913(-)
MPFCGPLPSSLECTSPLLHTLSATPFASISSASLVIRLISSSRVRAGISKSPGPTKVASSSRLRISEGSTHRPRTSATLWCSSGEGMGGSSAHAAFTAASTASASASSPTLAWLASPTHSRSLTHLLRRTKWPLPMELLQLPSPGLIQRGAYCHPSPSQSPPSNTGSHPVRHTQWWFSGRPARSCTDPFMWWSRDACSCLLPPEYSPRSVGSSARELQPNPRTHL